MFFISDNILPHFSEVFWLSCPLRAAMTTSTDFDNVDITQQYSRINTRFELSDEELDNDNSTARIFERSRIKALAGNISAYILIYTTTLASD